MDTVPALLTLCRKGPISGAKAAPRAVLAVEGRSLGSQHLAAVAEELISRLGKTGAASDPELPVILATLSSIGRLLPEASSVFLASHVCVLTCYQPIQSFREATAGQRSAVQVFSDRAGQIARFILGPLLRSAPSGNGQRLATRASRGWSNSSPHVKLKAFGIKVCAVLHLLAQQSEVALVGSG